MFVTAFQTFEIPVTSLSHAKLFNGAGTEVDEDVFEEVVKLPDLVVLKLTLDNEGMCRFSSLGHLWHYL